MRETALRTGNRSRDPKVRIRARLDVLLIEAISLLQRHDAQAAVALLDTYIEEGVRNDYYDFFPEARFVRALAWRTDGYDDRAESDLRIALDMSSNRATEPPEQKSTYFRTAEEATTELVDILVRRGAVDNAFSTLGASRRHLCRPWDWQSTTPDPDIVIVEYLALRYRLLVFVATDAVTLRTVDVDDKTLRDTAIQFAHDVQASRESPAGRRLSRWLLDPIEDHLHQGRLLMIIPDRAITNVSFASLQTGDKYLIERVDLAFAPSSSLVVKPSAIQPGKTVAVGDPATLLNSSPLPYARKEAGDVAQRYPDSELLLGRDATPERVLAGAREASVLHLATHAVVDQSYPLASYLALAPGEQSSGALTIDRIQWSALETAPLVVLAGCHTGAPPDGAPRVRTLALAFIAAGASNVVGTLWDLPDDPLSTEMSLRLHDELRRGVNPARALRTAQLSMLHSSDARRRDPAVWSAFQLWSAAPKRR